MGELVLIFLIALIFIGPKKLPELAKGLGQGIRDFQKAAKGLTDEFQKSADSPKTVEKVEEEQIASTPHHGPESIPEPELDEQDKDKTPS